MSRSDGGNGYNRLTSFFISVLGTLLVAAIIASASTSILTLIDVKTLSNELAHVKEDVKEIENPPQWFRDQVERIDQNLQEHMRQSGDDAHRIGGGSNEQNADASSTLNRYWSLDPCLESEILRGPRCWPGRSSPN